MKGKIKRKKKLLCQNLVSLYALHILAFWFYFNLTIVD